MARQIYAFAPVVPAGTLPSAPFAASLAIPVRTVDLVQIRVPPGPSGQVGFALGVSGTQVIPYNAGSWIVADNEPMDFPLDEFPDSGAWTLTAYNNGDHPHTIYVRLLTSLVGGVPVPLPVPIAASVLSGVIDLSGAPVPVPGF